MDQGIPKIPYVKVYLCMYVPMFTGVVGAIVLRPLDPLKFDLNESGGDPDEGSV